AALRGESGQGRGAEEMEAKREQAIVGLFVLIASGLLVVTVFALSGAFAGSAKTFHTYLSFAGGIEPGATVRYAGGPKVGRVEQLRIDPQNSARIEITFSVKSDLPVKSDSKVRIMSMSPLGDNHLEVVPGTAQAALAPSGATLPADTYVDFNAITARINDLAPQAQQLLATLNERATDLKETITRIDDLLNQQNRANLSAPIANTRGMLEENRPRIRSTLSNIDKSSAKLEPLIDDFRKTSAEANKTLQHVDEMIGEDRPDVHKAILQLRQNLDSLQDLTGQLNNTFSANSENIDEILENFRHVSENMKEFTETIKMRPY